MGDGKRPRGASQGELRAHPPSAQRVRRVEEAFRTLPSRTYRSRSAGIAFFAALRNIYLDAPHGRRAGVIRRRAA